MLSALKKFDELGNLAFFRFREFNGKVLLTTEAGEYIFLEKSVFNRFLNNEIRKNEPVYHELIGRGFIRNRLKNFELIEQYRQKNSFIWRGPTLHIIVVTLKCNHSCIYCQASAKGFFEKGYDMDKATAKKSLAAIFESPSKAITIELQGGEPLANWKTVEFICRNAIAMNKTYKKSLNITLVSNLSLLTKDKLKFLIDQNVGICTSLDGPRVLHDRNRKLFSAGSSYGLTTKKIKMVKKFDSDKRRLSALLTLSKFSLKYPKEIIEEYRKWGFQEIHLRPISNLGMSKANAKKIGYSSEEFANFYKKALDYLVKLNIAGKTTMSDRMAKIFLVKILLKRDPAYLDLRSPCGAGIGQIVYNYDGKVYTCDEARMLQEDTFLIGNVHTDSFKDIINSVNIPASCFASCQESVYCDYCVYKPYCGICPVINYAETGNLFCQLPNSRLCKMNSFILGYLFDRLNDEDYKKIFSKWIS